MVLPGHERLARGSQAREYLRRKIPAFLIHFARNLKPLLINIRSKINSARLGRGNNINGTLAIRINYPINYDFVH